MITLATTQACREGRHEACRALTGWQHCSCGCHNLERRLKIVSFSELDAARQCRFKHTLGYAYRWEPERVAPALDIGSLVHKVLEAHYLRIREAQRGGESVDAAALYAAVGPLLYDAETGAQSEYQELVEWMYRGYVDHYGVDDRWEILEVEKPYELWLPTAAGNRSWFKIKGKIDLVVRDRELGGIWVTDHKSCKNLPRGREYDLDDQFALYPWMMRQPGAAGRRADRDYGLYREEMLGNGGFNVRGAVHNAVRKERLKTREMEHGERFKRTITVRTDQELQTMASEVLDTFRSVYAQLRDARRRGGFPPRSPDPERCGWRCPFTEPCLMSRKGADVLSLLAETGYKQSFERH